MGTKTTLDDTIEFTVDWYKNYFSGNNIENISNYQIDNYLSK